MAEPWECDTHSWHSSPLTPLVVQKHLPVLVLHSEACPLHLHAGEEEKEWRSQLALKITIRDFPKKKIILSKLDLIGKTD